MARPRPRANPNAQTKLASLRLRSGLSLPVKPFQAFEAAYRPSNYKTATARHRLVPMESVSLRLYSDAYLWHG